MTLLRLRDLLIRFFRSGHAALREIFDESAYSRFLARNQAASSPQAYSAFLREQSHARSGRHRCC